jgi:hypothetical protein
MDYGGIGAQAGQGMTRLNFLLLIGLMLNRPQQTLNEESMSVDKQETTNIINPKCSLIGIFVPNPASFTSTK